MAVCLTLPLGACAGTQPIKYPESPMVTRDAYLARQANEGVVLMDVNWGRRWRCGGFDDAQLIGMAFDRQPMPTLGPDAQPSLVILNPSRLISLPVFRNHAFLVRSGVYALSTVSIKVARSQTEVYFATADRSRLYENGKPAGGTFVVNPGETVFIGNFFLDCTQAPVLWRYHPQTKADFAQQLAEYKSGFSFLQLDHVQYRLFETKHFGRSQPELEH